MSYSAPVSIIKIPAQKITHELLNEDEITWGKTLFDVIKRQMLHDTLYVYALSDEQEQSLVDKITAYLGAGTDIEPAGNLAVHPLQNVIKMLPQIYTNESQKSFLAICRNFSAFGEWKYFCASVLFDIPTPPPKRTQPSCYLLIS